jgi:myosin heavy subunit
MHNNSSSFIAYEKESFTTLLEALRSLNFVDAEIGALVKVIACILHLGNLSFNRDNRGEGCSINESLEIQKVSDLLSLNLGVFKQKLISKSIQAVNEIILVPLKAEEAEENRDSLCKFMYGKLFEWMIEKINIALQISSVDCLSIGILDIFGFENFDNNYFEQFCINFANEKMQNFLNFHIFTLEQEEYKREGISIDHFEFLSNQICLDLIEKNSSGILCLIDDILRMPKNSDELLLQSIVDYHSTNSCFQKSKHDSSHFVIVHYAGRVTYDVSGFLDKNRDNLSSDMSSFIKSSSLEEFRNIFADRISFDDAYDIEGSVRKNSPSSTATNIATDSQVVGQDLSENSLQIFRSISKSHVRKSSDELDRKQIPRKLTTSNALKKTSIGIQFKNQLSNLVSKLLKTEPHFIRCLKPNSENISGLFDPKLVLRQLKYLGIPSICEIRKRGYPIRMYHSVFIQRYQVIAVRFNIRLQSLDERERCSMIFMSQNISPEEWKLGSSKVLMKTRTEEQLDRIVTHIKESLVIWTQSKFRGRVARNFYRCAKNTLSDLLHVQKSIFSFSFIDEESFKSLLDQHSVVICEAKSDKFSQFQAIRRVLETIDFFFVNMKALDEACASLKYANESYFDKNHVSRREYIQNSLAKLSSFVSKFPNFSLLYPMNLHRIAEQKIAELEDYEANVILALESKNPSLNFVESIISSSKSLKLEGAFEKKLELLRLNLKRRIDAEANLEHLLSSPNVNITILQEAIITAKETGVSSSSNILTKALDKEKDFHLISQIKTLFENGITENNLDVLDEGFALLEKLHDWSSIEDLVGKAKETKSILIQKKTLTMKNAKLVSILMKVDVDAIDEKSFEQALHNARELGIDVSAAMKKLESHKKRVAINAEIDSFLKCEKKNYDALKKLALDCDSLEKETAKPLGAGATHLRALFSRAAQYYNILYDIKSRRNEETFLKALHDAEAIGLTHPDIESAQIYASCLRKRDEIIDSIQREQNSKNTNVAVLKAAFTDYKKVYQGIIPLHHKEVLEKAELLLKKLEKQGDAADSEKNFNNDLKPSKNLAMQTSSKEERARTISIEKKMLDYLKADYKIDVYPGLKSPQEFIPSATKFGLELFWRKSSTIDMQKSMLKWIDGKHTIPASITRLSNSSLSHSIVELNKLALKIFESIQGYMKDRHFALLVSESLEGDIIQSGSIRELRDEIFLQIVKQLTENPNQKSRVLGWRLFAKLLEHFSPSSSLIPYLINFCLSSLSRLTQNDDEKMNLKQTFEALSKALNLSQNVNVKEMKDVSPSPKEVISSKYGEVLIYLSNCKAVKEVVGQGVSIKDILPEILEKAGIDFNGKTKDVIAQLYGIYETELNGGERYLHPDRCLLDYKAASMNSGRKFLLLSFIIVLPLKLNFYSDYNERMLLAYELSENCRTKKYFSEDSQLLKYECLFRRLQVSLNDHEVRKTQLPLDYEFKVNQLLTLSSKNLIEFEQYFDELNQLNLLGSHVFILTQNDKPSYPKNITLALNYRGIHLLKSSLELIESFNYDDLLYRNASSDMLVMKLRHKDLQSSDAFYLQSKQARLILHIINCICKLRQMSLV